MTSKKAETQDVVVEEEPEEEVAEVEVDPAKDLERVQGEKDQILDLEAKTVAARQAIEKEEAALRHTLSSGGVKKLWVLKEEFAQMPGMYEKYEEILACVEEIQKYDPNLGTSLAANKYRDVVPTNNPQFLFWLNLLQGYILATPTATLTRVLQHVFSKLPGSPFDPEG